VNVFAFMIDRDLYNALLVRHNYYSSTELKIHTDTCVYCQNISL